MENVIISQPESVYAAAIGGTAAGTTNITANLPTMEDNEASGLVDSNFDTIDLGKVNGKTRPSSPGANNAGMTANENTLNNINSQLVLDGDLLSRFLHSLFIK